jgi:hypothetical protein
VSSQGKCPIRGFIKFLWVLTFAAISFAAGLILLKSYSSCHREQIAHRDMTPLILGCPPFPVEIIPIEPVGISRWIPLFEPRSSFFLKDIKNGIKCSDFASCESVFISKSTNQCVGELFILFIFLQFVLHILTTLLDPGGWKCCYVVTLMVQVCGLVFRSW